jgi:NAD-dependent DNA ligase
MQVVLTGTMTVPRSHMSHQIRSLGGSVLAAVSGKTTVLVIGKNPTQEKVDKAARLAVPLEDEAEFRKRLQ